MVKKKTKKKFVINSNNISTDDENDCVNIKKDSNSTPLNLNQVKQLIRNNSNSKSKNNSKSIENINQALVNDNKSNQLLKEINNIQSESIEELELNLDYENKSKNDISSRKEDSISNKDINFNDDNNLKLATLESIEFSSLDNSKLDNESIIKFSNFVIYQMKYLSESNKLLAEKLNQLDSKVNNLGNQKRIVNTSLIDGDKLICLFDESDYLVSASVLKDALKKDRKSNSIDPLRFFNRIFSSLCMVRDIYRYILNLNNYLI